MIYNTLINYLYNEKKDHLIKKLPNLSDGEKEDIISFFKNKPNLENKIDWNNKDLTYKDFKKLMDEPTKTQVKKQVRQSGMKGLIEGKDYIDFKTEDKGYSMYLPLTRQASITFGSKYVCGYEGKWCISQKKDKDTMWDRYHTWGHHFIFIIDIENNEKYSIQIQKIKPNGSASIFIWDKTDKTLRPGYARHLLNKLGITEKDLISTKEHYDKIQFHKMNWVELAEISEDADYNFNPEDNFLVWNNGTWKNGEWENGLWKDGVHEAGFWLDGTWENGTWKDGPFKGGTWKNGTWEYGFFDKGIWENGHFKGLTKGSIFRGDEWHNGTFEGKFFQNSIWKDGVFDGDSFNKSIWKKGTFKGSLHDSEFVNSIWEDGIFENGIIKGSDTVWHNGTFKNGKFFQGLWKNGTWKDGIWDVDQDDGEWNNGTWENGTWKTGHWKNGTWKNGTWKGGRWFDGVWENGTWERGSWIGGEWKGGTWENGNVFNPQTNKLERSDVNPNEFYKRNNIVKESMSKFNKLYESIIANQAPTTSDLRDDRIGDHYLTLTKKGSSYTIVLKQGDKQDTAKTKKSLSFKNEEKARAKYYEIRGSIIDKMEKNIR